MFVSEWWGGTGHPLPIAREVPVVRCRQIVQFDGCKNGVVERANHQGALVTL